MKIEWREMRTIPLGERVFLLLRDGQKGNGELAVGMICEHGDGWWTWGGPNSGMDDEENPIAWAPLPDNWYAPLEDNP